MFLKPYKPINLFDKENSVRGTQPTGTDLTINQIGRSKGRGVEYQIGVPTQIFLQVVH